MDLVLKTPPAVEPVLLADVKSHCNISTTADDTYISGILMPSAREFCERYMNRYLINQTWLLWLDNFNVRSLSFPINTVNAITSVKTYSETNVESVIDAANYQLLSNRLVFNDNYWSNFNNNRYFNNAVLEFVVGYGASGTAVPSSIKLAILQVVAHWYQNREAIFDPMLTNSAPSEQQVRLRATALLAPFRVLPI